MKRAFIRAALAALVLIPAPALAQRPDTLAWAGASGVYVWLGGSVGSRAHPVDGVVAHRLERRRPGAGAWERVDEVQAVASADGFFSRLDRATRSAVVAALRQPNEAAAWEYIVRFPRADSLARIIGDDRIRLALGIYALDTRVHPGETWEYRIGAVAAAGSVGRTVMTAPVGFPARPDFRPVNTARVEDGDSTAVIWWRIPTAGHPVRSVEVWRRRGREGDFSRVDSITSFIASGDTLFGRFEAHGLEPRAIYEYYAVPRDIFLNRGTAGDTATVYTVQALRYRLPDSLSAESDDTMGIVLRWRLAQPELVRAIQIFRAPSQDSGWRQIAELPRDARMFVDRQAPEMRITYYRLAVVGPRNEASPPTAAVFGYFQSSMPPAPPYGLQAQAGPGGRGVRLTWLRNGGRELSGYYLFTTPRAVDSITSGTPLTQAGGLIAPGDTTWLDTLSALVPGREYTYVLQAVSRSNVRSGYSNPAFFAPASPAGIARPTGLRGFVDGTAVQLFWDDMGAVDLGVAGYRVYRRMAGSRDTAFTPLTPEALPGNINTWTDTTVDAGRVYEYAVRGVDRAREQSAPSVPVRVAIPLPRPPAPAALRATAGPDGITVSWAEIEGLAGTVRVFRYLRGGRAGRLAEVQTADASYLDRTAQPGRRYYYYATLVVNGIESAPSLEATARR
ncbi:MAG: fibronectin type III domain-containing protein [Gemmatimonadales bacterium]